MDEVHETSQPSQVSGARNFDIQPIVKMPEQLDKRLRNLEDQVNNICGILKLQIWEELTVMLFDLKSFH